MLGEFFDPAAQLFIEERCRPHWTQAGAIVFITFRTHDSIPKEVLERWEHEKQDWIHRCGHSGHWTKIVPTLCDADRLAFNKRFERARNECLDRCHGRCLLKRPALATIVTNSLLHFDQQRYRMGDFIVMPNHVHLLAAFASEDAMKTQCDSWLHFTAFQINTAIGERGKFWQSEPFDHLVRSTEQYEYLRKYIEENPKKASLRPEEYLYRKYSE